MLSTFFFGHAAHDPVLGGGEPIYYNFMASTADMAHEDLVTHRHYWGTHFT